jgi:hypothetical protein
LNELDGVAVRISDPSGAQLAVEKVMDRREQRHALGDQGVQCGIGIISPNNDFDPAPFSLRMKAVVLFCRIDCSNSEAKSVQLEFDMDRFRPRPECETSR